MKMLPQLLKKDARIGAENFHPLGIIPATSAERRVI